MDEAERELIRCAREGDGCWGHTALTAFDGREAVDVLESKAVDVLVTDLKMPELDGMQVLEQGKQRWPETKRKTSGRSCRWMKPS